MSNTPDKPTAVRIAGLLFEIQHPVNVDKEKSYGEMKGEERYIKIRRSLEGEVFEASLLHEVIHGLLYAGGLAEILESHDDEGKEGKLEEAIVVCLENGLSQLYTRKDWT
jgi:hypothetical protein